ncbi:MAG: hypothetical protein CMJ49_10645 [Planctomycetaceae bacterium]|nr:hypothetical protein [Planctomycetaceae bacterium]
MNANSRVISSLIGPLLACVISACAAESSDPMAAVVVAELDRPVSVVLSWHGELRVIVRDITPDNSGDEYFGGPLLSIQIDAEDERIATHDFQTSYGLFCLDIIDLDGDREPEYVLVSGWGRGTSARRETITVFTVADGALVERYRAPYSDSFGSGAWWNYEHHYRDTDGDGLVELVLNLQHTPIGKGGLEDPNLIPAVATRALEFRPSRSEAQQ